MSKCRNILGLAGAWVLGVCLLPGVVLGQKKVARAAIAPVPAAPTPAPVAVVTAAPVALRPVGNWKGPLSTPGGSLLIRLAITEQGNKLAATLDLPAKRLDRVPTFMTVRGDTLVLYAASVDCRFVCVETADEQQLRGIWSQPGLRVPLVLSRFIEVAAPNDKTPVVAIPFHTEPVTLTSQPGNVQLAGTLSLPDGPGPYPAVVLLSDIGSQDRDARQGTYRPFADVAAALAAQGVAVLRLDDRGVGQSGGSGSLATITDLVHDAQAGLAYLRSRPTINPARAGLIGHGEGGNVALLAAAQPLPPNFVVAVAAAGLLGREVLANQPEPVADPADTARVGAARRQAWADVLGKAAKLRASGSNAAQVETYIDQQRLKVKNENRRQAEGARKFRRAVFEIVVHTANDDQAQAIVVNMLRQRYPTQPQTSTRSRATQLVTPASRAYLQFDPQAGLAAVQCPVLLLHGSDDAEVSAPSNLPALEKGLKANKRVTSRQVSDMNHALQQVVAGSAPIPVVSPALLGTIRDWVVQQPEE